MPNVQHILSGFIKGRTGTLDSSSDLLESDTRVNFTCNTAKGGGGGWSKTGKAL
jgi:hypothetical protein